MATPSPAGRSATDKGRQAIPAEKYAALRDKYPGLHPQVPAVVPAELTVEPDGTSWTARENLTDIITREVLGPRNGDEETLTSAPEHVYFVGRIAPKKLQRRTRKRAVLTPPETGEHSDDPPPAADNNNASPAPAEQPLPQDFTDFDTRQSTGVPVHSVDTSEPDGEQDAVDDDPQRRGLMIPASMGLRFHIDRATTAQFIVRARWATYGRRAINPTEPCQQPASSAQPQRARSQQGASKKKNENKQRPKFAYARTPNEHTITVEVAELSRTTLNDRHLQGEVMVRLDRYDIPGTQRSIIEVALCNDYETPEPIQTEAWLFQTALDVETLTGSYELLPIADPITDPQEHSEAELAALALQYRNRLEYATGRTCSASWLADAEARRAKRVSTCWLPTYELPQVRAESRDDVTLDMMTLATAPVAEVLVGLEPIVAGYSDWIAGQHARRADLPDHLHKTFGDAVCRAEQIRDGLRRGLDELQTNPEAVKAFQFMNHAMAEQRIHTQVAELRSTDPNLSLRDAREHVLQRPHAHSWRMFQLAFILLNIPAMTTPDHPQRVGDIAHVNLLFFPTGGGKTEAYLGLAAFTFAIRRLQGSLDTPDGTLDGTSGVAVLMRYTLRLLTAQQFQRATTLVCAAETIRQSDEKTWGEEPFRIGLWVGTDVTPKSYDQAEEQLRDAQGRRDRLTVLQLQVCPWCGSTLGEKDVHADKVERRIRVFCPNDLQDCPFAKGNAADDGIPALTTDEEIYRLTPAFLVATVDKFARLTREGAAAALFGYVKTLCERHGYTHEDDSACDLTSGAHSVRKPHPKARRMPCDRLRPVDLIIQDELHLITGALGTTVGLFETAIDVATTWTTPDGTQAKPLIVASTATSRNAAQQVYNLFGRGVQVFPPQVLDVNETYFSTEIPVTPKTPGRRYLGVSTTGVRMANAETKISAVLMQAAQHIFDTHGAVADPYMTLVGYFNATRELGGYLRYLKTDISTALRKPTPSGLPRRLWGLAQDFQISELTSRASGTDISKSLRNLAVPFDDQSTSAGRQAILDTESKYYPQGRPIDVVLATSMLQVGVDVTRLGLMLMVGQPKNTAEYIQASSRVGRDNTKPGLVIALSNWARPRDLAHFEQFGHYHNTFYSQVEALSITPFSVTAMDRGLAATVISAARILTAHHKEGLSPNTSAGAIKEHGEFMNRVVDALKRRVEDAALPTEARDADTRLHHVVDRWAQCAEAAAKTGKTLAYTVRERQKDIYSPLVVDAENTTFARTATGHGAPFPIANSMREVQPEITLRVSPLADRMQYVEPPDAPQWAAPGEDTN